LTWFSHRGNQTRMANISQLSAAQLHQAAEVQTKIEALQAELAKVLGGTSSLGKAAKVGPARAPTVARAKAPSRKRKLSAAGRARLVALAKARWAKIKAAGKKRL
jgi:hypothetical protein